MTTRLDPVLSSPGWELLASLESLIDRRDRDSTRLDAAMRHQGVDAPVVAAILTQLDLRDHAESKFGEFARSMVFTRDGLEQATRLTVAARHAERFRSGGATHVADLGCGIGGDALALAGLGLGVLAVDIDEDAAAAAAVNLRAFPDAEVILGDVSDLDLDDLREQGIDALFADPARRTGTAGGSARRLGPEQWSPPLSTVLSWRGTFERVGVKMAPGVPHAALPDDCHAQWTSVDGDLVEAALWTPPLSPEGPGRSALVLRGGGAHTLADPTIASASTPVRQASVGPLGALVAEPDPAVIRSGLVARLAEDLGAQLVSPSIAWLTGDDLPETPFAARFEVLDVVALRPKAIQAALDGLDVGSVEVKKRGVDLDPAALRRSLRLRGSGTMTLIATRVEGRHCAILARRCQT
ncbi:MAG: THUMP-like domain-containing protein [Pauljensenia sp.]